MVESLSVAALYFLPTRPLNREQRGTDNHLVEDRAADHMHFPVRDLKAEAVPREDGVYSLLRVVERAGWVVSAAPRHVVGTRRLFDEDLDVVQKIIDVRLIDVVRNALLRCRRPPVVFGQGTPDRHYEREFHRPFLG